MAHESVKRVYNKEYLRGHKALGDKTMDKLSIWDSEHILDKISLCTLEKGQKIERKKTTDFPLPDILKDFYRDAEICGDFYSKENLKLLYDEYNEKQEHIGITVEQLQQDGWILVMYDRWSSSLKSLSIWEKIVIDNEYKDEKIIRFLVWLGKKARKKYNIKISDPENKLEKWRGLYRDLPDVDWFVQQHYLVMENNNYYAYRAYTYWNEIDQALAGLWLEWKEEKSAEWMKLARALHGTYDIFKYLDYGERRNLFLYIQDEFFYKMDIPNWEQTNEFYRKKRLFESAGYLKNPDKYNHVGLWCGNRVLDRKNYNQYGFEYYRNEDVHEYDSMLILYPMLLYMEWGTDGDSKSFCGQLEKYDEICQFYMFYHYSPSLLYEMFVTKGTFYMAFRELVRCQRNSLLSEEIFEHTVVEIVQKIFEEGCKRKNFLNGQQIGMCLLDLMYIKTQKKYHEDSLLVKIIDLVGTKTYFEVIWKDMHSYFQELFKLENTVEWVNAYHLILICIKRWFYMKPDRQECGYFDDFLEVVWEGYQIVFNRGEHIKFLDVSYLEPEICNSLYEKYIQKNNSSEKRKRLFARIDLDNAEDTIPYYYFKKLLEILYNILDMQEEKDEVVKSVFIEVLEQALLKEQAAEGKKNRAYFEYSYMQIYSAEDIIAKCIKTLSSTNNSEKYIMEQLLERDIPDLLVYFEAAADEEFKTKLIDKINEKAAIDSLNVFHDERAIDIVLDNKIASLYPAVQDLIEKKLAGWKKNNLPEKSDVVRYALHQKWRLKYIRGEYKSILEGNNKFFQAIVYTEIEGYKDFTKADQIWRSMIESKDKDEQFASVYLNYLYLLDRELSSGEEGEKEHIEYVNHQFEWVCRIIEDEKILCWGQKQRENYVWFVVGQKIRMGEDYLLSFYSNKSKYELAMSVDEVMDTDQSKVEQITSGMRLNHDYQDISDAIRVFWAQTFEKKAGSYYLAKGITEIEKPGQTLLVDAVLTTCDVLYNFGPQLVHIIKNDEKGLKDDKPDSKNSLDQKNVKYKLYEDNVTILFREIFNHLFGDNIKICVHDQQKMGNTGYEYGGVFSPSEIDLTFYYDEGQHEIGEAFVLNDNTSKAVFKDHMGKIMGNNTRHEPLSFMLVFGNLYKSLEAWKKYSDYIENGAGGDFADQGIAGIECLAFDEAPYYIKKFEHKYPWLNVTRQKIIFDDGREQEVLHIFIDMSRSREGNIRRSTK